MLTHACAAVTETPRTQSTNRPILFPLEPKVPGFPLYGSVPDLAKYHVIQQGETMGETTVPYYGTAGGGIIVRDTVDHNSSDYALNPMTGAYTTISIGSILYIGVGPLPPAGAPGTSRNRLITRRTIR